MRRPVFARFSFCPLKVRACQHPHPPPAPPRLLSAPWAPSLSLHEECGVDASSRLSAMLHETLGGAVHRRYRPAAAGPSTCYYPPTPPRTVARMRMCVFYEGSTQSRSVPPNTNRLSRFPPLRFREFSFLRNSFHPAKECGFAGTSHTHTHTLTDWARSDDVDSLIPALALLERSFITSSILPLVRSVVPVIS